MSDLFLTCHTVDSDFERERLSYHHALEVLTPPAALPVTTAHMKEHLFITHDFDDALIERYITAATSQLEFRTNRQFVTATFKAHYHDWPRNDRSELVIPRPPLGSVSKIEYIDADGDLQELSADVYQVIPGDPAGVVIAENATWPTLGRGNDAVFITFTAGYGNAAAVPEDIKTAIQLMVSQWYDARADVIVGSSVASLPNAVNALIGPYRYRRV